MYRVISDISLHVIVSSFLFQVNNEEEKAVILLMRSLTESVEEIVYCVRHTLTV